MSFAKATRKVTERLPNKSPLIGNSSFKHERKPLSYENTKQNALLRSPSLPNKKSRPIVHDYNDYSYSKTENVKDFDNLSGIKSAELVARNADKYANNFSIDFYEHQIKNSENKTYSPSQYSSFPTNVANSKHRNSSFVNDSIRINGLRENSIDYNYKNNQSNWQNDLDKRDYKNKSNAFGYEDNNMIENKSYISPYPSNSYESYGTTGTRNRDYQPRDGELYYDRYASEMELLRDENANLKRSKSTLEMENKNSKFKCDNYLEEIGYCKAELADLERTKGILQQELNDCTLKLKRSKENENELARKSDQIEQFRKDIQYKLDFELFQSESKRKSLQNENDNLKSKYLPEIERLKSKIREIDRNSGRERENMQLQSSNENMRSEYVRLVKENEKLKSEIDKQNRILRKQSENNNSLELREENANLKQIQFSLETEIKNLTSQRDKCLLDIKCLNLALAETQQTKGKLQQDYQDHMSKSRHSQLEWANHSKSQIDRNQCGNCAKLIKQLENEKAAVKRQTYQIENNTKDFQLKLKDSNQSNKNLESQLNQSKDKLKSLQNENAHIESKYLTEIERLKSTIKGIDEKSVKYKDNLQQENDNLKLLIKEIDGQNKLMRNNCDEWNLKFDQSEKDKENLKQQYSKLQTINENLKSECDKLLMEMKYLKSEIKEIDGQNKLMRNNYDECNLKFDQSEKDKENLKQKYSKLQTINENLKSEYDKLLEQNEKLKIKEIDGQNKIVKNMNEINQSDKLLNDLQTENENFKSERDKLLMEIKQLKTKIKEIEEHNKILQNNYEEYKLKFDQSEKDQENLKQKYSKLQTINENLKSEYDKLLEENLKLKSKIKEIDEQNKLMRNNYDECNFKFGQSEKDKENLKQKYSKLQTINENLKSECDKLLIEMEYLKSEIKEIDGQNKIVKNMNEINQSDKLLNDLLTENENFKSERDKLLMEIKQLKSEIKEIDGQNKILQNNCDEWNLKFGQSERNKENVEQKCAELRTEVEYLTSLSNERLAEIEYWKSKSNENLQIRNDEFQSQLKRLEEKYKESQSTLNAVLIENDKLNLQTNNVKLHSNTNIKSNHSLLSQESDQIKPEPPLKINYSDNHNKIFLRENGNKEQQKSESLPISNNIAGSGSFTNKEKRKKSPRSLTNTDNIQPLNYKNKALQEPIGFENPKGYCFLNCVIQQLYSCTEFKDELIQYHRKDSIASDQSNPQASDEDKIFVNNFSRLMEEIDKRNITKISDFVSKIQTYFIQSSSGDDVLKCFMTILSILSNVTKVKSRLHRNRTIQGLDSKASFEYFQNQNEGFVFRCFYGQMAFRLVCRECEYSVNTSYQLFKSIGLPVPTSHRTIRLEDIIKIFLEKSPVDSEDKRVCHCKEGSNRLYSITDITHLPLYLFIYLNRGSYYKYGTKNNNHVTCGNILNFPMKEELIPYKLISVIDHIGNNLGGHYYAKSCFETDQWWMLNDSSVYRISGDNKIATENTIVFLFKKLSNEN